MDRSEIMEIRKLFTYKKGDMATDNHSCCFINTNKEIKGKHTGKFLKLEDEVIHKLLDNYKKTMSNNAGTITFSGNDKKDGGMQFLLEKVRNTKAGNQAINDILYEKIRDALPENNFMVTMLAYNYDVPVKTKDRLKIDDAGSELFNFIICTVCPIKTTDGTLGYIPKKDLIGENERQLIAEKPVFGFMYPAFNDRSADTGAALCYEAGDDGIIQKLFGQTPEAAPTLSGAEKGPKIKKTAKAANTESKSLSANTATPEATVYKEDAPGYTAPRQTEPDSAGDTTSGVSLSDTAYQPAVSRADTVKLRSTSKKFRISGNVKGLAKKLIDGKNYYIIPAEDVELEEG